MKQNWGQPDKWLARLRTFKRVWTRSPVVMTVPAAALVATASVVVLGSQASRHSPTRVTQSASPSVAMSTASADTTQNPTVAAVASSTPAQAKSSRTSTVMPSSNPSGATPSVSASPVILTRQAMTVYGGTYDYNRAELNPMGNPDGTVSDSQILCNASGQAANGQIRAQPAPSTKCSNSLSFMVVVNNGTPQGVYALRATFVSMTGAPYYGIIQVTVPAPPTSPPAQP